MSTATKGHPPQSTDNPTLPQTQLVATQEVQPDTNTTQQEPTGWARIISISRGINSLNPPLDFPTTSIINDEVFKIGRADTNHLVIPHLGVSGLHLELRRSRNEDMVTIIDHSTNGTWIDGERMQRNQPKEIDFGQKIDILRVDQLRVSFTISQAGRSGAALLAGKYLVRRNLGTGAYAEVKLALDPSTGHQYAMKIIDRSKLGLQANAEEQLITEVSILKSLDHHCIVRVYDWFANNARFYIALDYMPAGDLLEHLLQRQSPFNEEESKDIFCQLVEAVEYLHAHNVVHRDIKPENILLDDRERLFEDKLDIDRSKKAAAGFDPNAVASSQQPQSQSQPPGPINLDVTASQQARLYRESTKDRTFISKRLQRDYDLQPHLGASRLRIKLTDFGLSKSTDNLGQGNGTPTRLSTICGTPQYLAPEVLKHFQPGSHSSSRDREYGREVDVWSIGAILFVILTMHTPFPENDLIPKVLAGKYDKHRLTDFSSGCQDVIRRMLVVDPHDRISVHDIRKHPWASQLFQKRAEELRLRKEEAALAGDSSDDNYQANNASTPTKDSLVHIGDKKIPSSSTPINQTDPSPSKRKPAPCGDYEDDGDQLSSQPVNKRKTSPRYDDSQNPSTHKKRQ